MDFISFQSRIHSEITKKLQENETLAETKVEKNNGAVFTALSLRTDQKEEISPLLYLEQIYGNWQEDPENFSFEETTEQILNILRKESPDLQKIKESLRLETARDRIIPKLVNHSRNLKTAEKFVHRNFLDLEIFYCIRLETFSGEEGYLTVPKDLLSEWEITEEELHRIAIANAKKQKEVLKPLSELISGNDYKKDEENLPPIYVLTNSDAYFGAATMIYSDEIRRLADSLDDDLYILPASIHEIILVKKEGVDVCTLRDMVQTVNSTEVRPEELLGGSIYLYLRNRNNIVIAMPEIYEN